MAWIVPSETKQLRDTHHAMGVPLDYLAIEYASLMQLRAAVLAATSQRGMGAPPKTIATRKKDRRKSRNRPD